jgi:hypothetical protein
MKRQTFLTDWYHARSLRIINTYTIRSFIVSSSGYESLAHNWEYMSDWAHVSFPKIVDEII